MSSIAFAEAARCLGATARRAGFDAPTFRSPPRRPGVKRTIRRRADGSCIVSVCISDRPLAATIADMIDGIVAANASVDHARSSGAASARSEQLVVLRDELWAAASHLLAASVADDEPIETLSHRMAA